MKREAIGSWFVPFNAGDEVGLLLKLPSHVLKHIRRGCRVRFSVATIGLDARPLLLTAFTVYDDPQSPQAICGAERIAEEHRALVQALSLTTFPAFFFDELSRPVARASCHFVRGEAAALLDRLNEAGGLYVGPFNEKVIAALDCFQESLNITTTMYLGQKVDISQLELSFGRLTDTKMYAIGFNEVGKTSLLEADEGQGLEQAVWQLLEGSYGPSLYRSPQVNDDGKQRELTDVLTTDPSAMLVIEAKAAAALTTAEQRSTTRRVASIQKQIDKGINQLHGAIKRLRSSEPLWSASGKPIAYVSGDETLTHAVVIVSEMHGDLDWSEVRDQLLAASGTSMVPFHVMDLQELRMVVALSGTPELIGFNLLKRFEAVAKGTHANIRGRVPPE